MTFPNRSLPPEILIPIIEFDIIGRRFTFPSFRKFSETQHEGCPFHAAMRGELVYLAPVLMGKEDDSVIPANPFLWTRLNAPMHLISGKIDSHRAPPNNFSLVHPSIA